MAEETNTSPPKDDYKWPSTLYREMRDMAAISFMIYNFGYGINCSRIYKDEFKGLDSSSSDSEDKSIVKSSIDNNNLGRSFTPSEIKKLAENNIELLQKESSSDFTGGRLDGLYSALDKLDARASESGLERPLTLEEFDDLHQVTECVYGITKDDIEKRITVAFRGTDKLGKRDLIVDVSIFQKEVELPESLQGKWKDAKELHWHTGFYDYIFSKTADQNDEESTTKYDQLLGDLKSILIKYPGYKVYVTGHSLGAALSSIVAFYFALDPELPKPISCINFASPRVGGHDVFQAVYYLEKTKQLRMLRVVNENDLVTTLPSVCYRHFGHQVDLYKKKWLHCRNRKPDFTYFNPTDSWWEKFKDRRTNSILSNFNLGYDHGDYISRIQAAEADLEKTSLNNLYDEQGITII